MSDEGGKENRRKWWHTAVDAWFSPAGVMVLLGAIIWGVQLNLAAVETAKIDARQDKRLEALEVLNREQSIHQAKTATLLDEIARRMERYSVRLNNLERGIK